jgi:hypothetical protein
MQSGSGISGSNPPHQEKMILMYLILNPLLENSQRAHSPQLATGFFNVFVVLVVFVVKQSLRNARIP